MRVAVYFIAFTFLASCNDRFEEKELYGLYSPVKYSKTFDTIHIRPGGKYFRRVYNRDNRLVLEQVAKWSLDEKTIIHFDSYFLNLDRDVDQFPELLKDTAGGGGGPLWREHGTIIFCVGYHEGQNCYLKLR